MGDPHHRHNHHRRLVRRHRNPPSSAHLRPKPPHLQPISLNDVVDAFYTDGWCTGVITTVVDSGNFVTQMVPTTEAAGLMFTVGKKVEVSFDRESLRDCWLPATILKNSGNKTFLVKYQQPGSCDGAAPHKVTVDYLHIRPSPPHLRDKSFVLLEKVDAYYDFGWWSGVITRELADNRYVVFFKHTKKEREFIYSRVRPHMEWKDGKWFSASQGDTNGRTTHSLIDEQIEKTTPSIDDQFTVATSIMKRTRQENLDNIDKGSPPSKKLLDMNYDSSEKANGQPEGFYSELINLVKGSKAETLITDSSRKRGRLSNELRSLQASDTGCKANSFKTGTQEIVGEKDFSKDSAYPDVMGLQCNGMPVSPGKMLQKRPIEKTPNLTESNTQRPSVPFAPITVADKEGSEVDAASVAPKRKRGRPPKLQVLSHESSVTFNSQKGGVVPSALSPVEVGHNKEVGLTTGLVNESLEENQIPVKEQPGKQNALLNKDMLSNEHTGQDLDGQLGQETKRYSTKKGRGRRKTISINTKTPAQDSQKASEEKTDRSLEKDSVTRNPEAFGKLLEIMSDDRSLSRRFEAKHSPKTVHGPGTVDPSSKLSERPVTHEMDSEDLPFVKTTSLWKAIESMETFRMLPQKPHFRPLLKGVKESAREGLAIGTMVTFSTIVDKTRSLRSDDPRSTIEDYLETLVELEDNGFDVKVIRNRLTRLLLTKDKQEELAERSKRVAEKIEEHNVQGKRDDEEIEAIDSQIRELEERRKQLLEKRNSEIGVIEAMYKKIEQELRGVGAEFDGLAATPLRAYD